MFGINCFVYKIFLNQMILFENPQILALNKPRFVHSTGSGVDTMRDTIFTLFPEAALSSPNSDDSGLVNRLDFETSGILIVAKSADSWRDWHNAFTHGQIRKEYLALVEGVPPKSARISNFIGSRYRGSKKVMISECDKARHLPAESYIELVKPGEKNRYSLVRVRTSTGRRHQVRAHCSHYGHPLVGDFLYGASREVPSDVCESAEVLNSGNLGFFLHASVLTRGDTIIEAPLIGQFKDLITRLFALTML